MEWFVKAFIRASLAWFTLGLLFGIAMAVYPPWVIYRPAHAHMNVVGFLTMMVFGVGYQLLPRLFGHGLYSRRLAVAHWWLANVGLAGMVAGFIAQPHIGSLVGRDHGDGRSAVRARRAGFRGQHVANVQHGGRAGACAGDGADAADGGRGVAVNGAEDNATDLRGHHSRIAPFARPRRRGSSRPGQSRTRRSRGCSNAARRPWASTNTRRHTSSTQRRRAAGSSCSATPPMQRVWRRFARISAASRRRSPAGDFSTPGFVHMQDVPGTKVMREKRSAISYEPHDLPRGAELLIGRRTRRRSPPSTNSWLSSAASTMRAAWRNEAQTVSCRRRWRLAGC